MVYGPRDTSTLKYIRAVSLGLMPYLGGWGANRVNVLYGSDMGAACSSALTHAAPSGRTYHLNDGNVYVWRELLLKIQVALGRPALSGAPLPTTLLKCVAGANQALSALWGASPALSVERLPELCDADWLCDSSEAQRELKWEPTVRWGDGIKLAVSWYRTEGWL
jgi:nucleoside-diphosphate-sugar epimerase